MGLSLSDAARAYAASGYAVFPCTPGEKTPATRRGYKDATTNAEQIATWWAKIKWANIGLATAGLLVVDIDGPDNPWPENPEHAADLALAPTSTTPRGGRHIIFRQPAGKQWRSTTGKIAAKVDTRGDGGYIIVPPSEVGGRRYQWRYDGHEDVIPVARHELPTPPQWLIEIIDRVTAPVVTTASTTRGEIAAAQITSDIIRRAAAYIDAMPPAISGSGGHNATYTAAVALVHGFLLPRDVAYHILAERYNPRCEPPWSEKELWHKIDDAACRTHNKPPGWLLDGGDASVDISGLVEKIEAPQKNESCALCDTTCSTEKNRPIRGAIPDHLFRVPGLISEVMDHCLATAPYPNQVMAFCGALALQSFLAGRRIRDPGDNRTNLYLLALAHSAAGKDHPRKINTRIIHEIGLAECLGGTFASGEGIQDALFVSPAMLFQTDEIDGLLQQINKATDARYESIMSTLLTIYSSANSVYAMRRKAGKEFPGVIDQPSLTIFGTAIPTHYYIALSERMLTNGFFARMIVLESGPRPTGQEPRTIDIPPRVIEIARWWADYRPGRGDLASWHPTPCVVEHTDEARRILIEAREMADEEYAAAEERDDPVGTTIWGRANEHVRKMALVYAASARHDAPVIDAAAARWATEIVMHHVRQMLARAESHVAETPFQAECLKLLEWLRSAPDGYMLHSALLRRMKMDAGRFRDLIDTLAERGDIIIERSPQEGHGGRAAISYRLSRQEAEA